MNKMAAAILVLCLAFGSLAAQDMQQSDTKPMKAKKDTTMMKKSTKTKSTKMKKSAKATKSKKMKKSSMKKDSSKTENSMMMKK